MHCVLTPLLPFAGCPIPGVVTVTVDKSVSAGDRTISNAVVNVLNDEFDVNHPTDLADKLILCMPEDAMTSSIAYAAIGGYRSVYRDEWCTYLSAQVHEVGHNLGLAHSNEDGAYKDTSGMMGYSYGKDDVPLVCFNGAKSWQLGWYASRHHEFQWADTSWSGRLIGQADHMNDRAAATDVVVLKLNTESAVDYYVAFNRKTGNNVDTDEGADQLMITRQGGEGEGYSESELLAKLGAQDFYAITNFDDSGHSLVVTVESINLDADPGFAEVTVSPGCNRDRDCDDGDICNGSETCNEEGRCIPGTPTFDCCGNGVCDAGETVFTCPSDGCSYGGCGADCRTLTTTFDDNNGSFGNYFKVRALRDLIITGFTIHTKNAGSGTVKIWEKAGDYAGSEYEVGDWHAVQDEDFTGMGRREQSPLPSLSVPVFVTAGSIRSFYVYSSLGVRYTRGINEGDAYATNAGEIVFYEGKGSNNELGQNDFDWAPRVWNGIIEYQLAPSGTPLPSTAEPTPQPAPSPTNLPTFYPTQSPTLSLTGAPSAHPTKRPTWDPTPAPIEAPSVPPAEGPTQGPTTSPVKAPSVHPTKGSTQGPTPSPTKAPAHPPTNTPLNTLTPHTAFPTVSPPTTSPSTSTSPTRQPTGTPSTLPPSSTPTVLSITYTEFTSSMGWRIWTTPIYSSWTWNVSEIEFYTNVNCSGVAIPNSGSPVDSGNRGSTWGAEQAFGGEGTWAGRQDSDGVYWIGMEYESPLSVKCVRVLNDVNGTAAAELRVQALMPNDGGWENAWIATGLDTSPDVWNVISLTYPVHTEPPTTRPTGAPTGAPTAKPTQIPTEEPTVKPSENPTKQPTGVPTGAPTAKPTPNPTVKPTDNPTKEPTYNPTLFPTDAHTTKPSDSPSKVPTYSPTPAPTEPPTTAPTETPTRRNTLAPFTLFPTPATNSPTKRPTKARKQAKTKQAKTKAGKRANPTNPFE